MKYLSYLLFFSLFLFSSNAIAEMGGMKGKAACMVDMQVLYDGTNILYGDYGYRNKSLVLNFDKGTVVWDRGREDTLEFNLMFYKTGRGDLYTIGNSVIKHIKIDDTKKIKLHFKCVYSGDKKES